MPPPIAATFLSGETAMMFAGAPPTFSTAGPTGCSVVGETQRSLPPPASHSTASTRAGCAAAAVPTSAAARSKPVSRRLM